MKQIKKVLFSTITLVTITACSSAHEPKTDNLLLDTPNISNNFKNEYLDAINTARSKARTCGTAGYFKATTALDWNDRLYDAAYEHSNDMATSNIFSHNGSGEASDIVGVSRGKSSTGGERVKAYGYAWRIYAENIGAGSNMDTAEKLMRKLLKSEGHCANIMNPSLKEIGMAMVKKPNSKYTYYWTQDFGTPLDSQ